MTDLQRWLLVLALTLGTLLTRFIPFWFFPDNKPLPPWLSRLGQQLPFASLGMLLVYALKDVNLNSSPYGLNEGLSLMVITLIHKMQKNMLVSIFTGLFFYLILVNYN